MIQRMIVLSMLLLSAFGYLLFAAKPEIVPIRESLAHLPMKLGTWDGWAVPEMDSRVLEVLGVDDYVERLYYAPDQTFVGLYIGYYQSQRMGDTIHSPMNCLPGIGWNPIKRENILVPILGNGSIDVNFVVIARGMDKQVVLYWYQSHGRVVASEYLGKAYSILDALRTNRTDAAIVRLISPVLGQDNGSVSCTRKRVVEFAKVIFPMLERFLPV